jgi:RluA family pseudouridine synthase/mutator protein MutT
VKLREGNEFLRVALSLRSLSRVGQTKRETAELIDTPSVRTTRSTMLPLLVLVPHALIQGAAIGHRALPSSFRASRIRGVDTAPSGEMPLTSWIRNGTKVGYAVHHESVVPAEMPTMPLPELLVAVDPRRYPSMSRARKACRRGTVLVNGMEGRCITTAGGGDTISLQSRVQPGFSPRGKPPFALEIAYEDDALAVVVKPAGVCTHPPSNAENRRLAGAANGNSMRTAVQYALRPPPVGTVDALYRPHICHRLDRPTSGLLLCAKTRPALAALTAAFRDRRITKQYRAIVCGRVEGEAGDIDSQVMGRPAQTSWRVVQRGRSLKLGGGHLTELALFPHTGRTHQLRRHCKEVLGLPIVGDKKYGGDDAGSGLYLAAVELSFVHPDKLDGSEPLRVSIDPPNKFASLMAHEQSRWQRLGDESALGLAEPPCVVEPYTASGLRRVAAVVLAREATDGTVEVLLERREGDDLDGMHCFPGGKHEPGETMVQAAVRESQQELGIGLDGVSASLGVVETKSAAIEHFLVRKWVGEPSPKEGQKIVWVAAQSLEELALTPSARGALATLWEVLK